jgi:hypothetical protein
MRRRVLLVLLSLAVTAAFAPVSAGAAVVTGAEGGGPLSPTLEALADPAVRALPAAAEAEALGVAPSGPGSLVREDGEVLVDLRLAGATGPALGALREAGARIVAVDPALGRATVAVAPAAIEGLAEVGAVRAAEAVPAPLVYAADCEGGAAISEGVAQLRAALARSDHGVDGSGITVGILSDSYDRATTAADGKTAIATHAAEDVASGDLPGPASGCPGQETAVDVLGDPAPEAGQPVFDEGRAMAQAVHDVAPGAKLAFASAYQGELAFAESIERLAAPVLLGGAGADVIVDDISYFEEPFFQNGPVAAAVEKVVGDGVAYVSAAGNNNLFDAAGNEIASWETPAYRDSGGCPAPVAKYVAAGLAHCLDFDPGEGVDNTFGITVSRGSTLTLDLQWAEPWDGVGTDENAYLIGPDGSTIVAASLRPNTGRKGTQEPVELLQWTNSESSARVVQLVVNRPSGGNPRTKVALLQNGGGVTATEYPRSAGGDVVGPTVFGHAAAAGAIAVGAIRWSSTAAPERFSSRGPATNYFGPVAGITAAAALPAPEALAKPDVTATDCARTTFFASSEVQSGTKIWRFCGTSQAAPHVAGVVALMDEAAEDEGIAATPEEMATALRSSATPIGAFGGCAVGAGLVDADGAIAALLAGAAALPTDCLSPPSAGPAAGAAQPQPAGPSPSPAPGSPGAGGASELPPTPIPARAPQTAFRRKPAATVTASTGARVVFVLTSDQSPAEFLCRLDRGAYRPCGARVVRTLAAGAHVFRAKARNAAGLVDDSPAVARVRVLRPR